MGFFKNYSHVESHADFVCVQIGWSIQSYLPLIAHNEELVEQTWTLWEFFAEYQVHKKNIDIQKMVQTLQLFGRNPRMPTYSYIGQDQSSRDIQDQMRLEIQTFLRPHRSVAFLPQNYLIDRSPLSLSTFTELQKIFTKVNAQEGYGEKFNNQIFAILKKYDYVDADDEELWFSALVLADSFISVLKVTNSLDRKSRIRMRLAARELLPLYPAFLLCRHLP